MKLENGNRADLLKCIDEFMDKGLYLQPIELPTYFLCKKLIQALIVEDFEADERAARAKVLSEIAAEELNRLSIKEQNDENLNINEALNG